MMTAKDTVIKLNCGGILSDIEVEYYNRGAAAQAEISFKAGGREVVEWAEKNFESGSYQSGTYHFYTILFEIWQTQKKLWGIK